MGIYYTARVWNREKIQLQQCPSGKKSLMVYLKAGTWANTRKVGLQLLKNQTVSQDVTFRLSTRIQSTDPSALFVAIEVSRNEYKLGFTVEIVSEQCAQLTVF